MKTKKVIALSLSIIMVVGILSGCGMEVKNNVDVKNRSITVESKIYATEEEIVAMEKESGEPIDRSEFKQVEKNGKQYYIVSDEKETIKGYNNLKGQGIILDDNRFVIYANTLDSDIDLEEFDFIENTYYFNKNILTSSEKIGKDKRTITISDDNNYPKYVTFTRRPLTYKTIKSNINTKYTNKKKVFFTADAIITGMTVNGKKHTPTIYMTKNSKGVVTLHKDYYNFSKHLQTYKIKVSLNNGYSKTFTYVYDKLGPKVSVASNKKYKVGKKITVTDKGGISYIKLNGKNIKNNTAIKKAGKYTLKTADKAGNVKTVKFTVVK